MPTGYFYCDGHIPDCQDGFVTEHQRLCHSWDGSSPRPVTAQEVIEVAQFALRQYIAERNQGLETA